MSEDRLFADKFYSEREGLVKQHFGKKLDGLKEILEQLYSPCMTRLITAEQYIGAGKGLTIKDVIDLEPPKRQMIVASTLYYDALWRLEAAYLMLCIGIINIAYSNLRSCLENVIAAYIVENIESESLTFLKGGKINQAAIAPFLIKKYNDDIKQIKEKLGKWGVHSCVESTMIGVVCNPNAFDKMIYENKISKPQTLHQEFGDYAETCLQAINTVFLIFMFLIKKGTKYKREL